MLYILTTYNRHFTPFPLISLSGFSGCWKCYSSCIPWDSVSSATKWTWQWAEPSLWSADFFFRWRTNLPPRAITPTWRSSLWETLSGTFLTRILVDRSKNPYFHDICHGTNMKSATRLRNCFSCHSSSQQMHLWPKTRTSSIVSESNKFAQMQ